MTFRWIGWATMVGLLALGGLAACGGDDSEDNAAAGGAAGAGEGGGAGEAGAAGTGGAAGAAGGTAGSAGGTVPTKVERVDLLFMVGNSASMGDKQSVLAASIPDLVQRLGNPLCVDAQGQPVASQPAKPLDSCPAGSERQTPPVLDLHVGVISSSLGGHGSDRCSPEPPGIGYNERQTDMSHLLQRQCGDADCSTFTPAQTYANKGFLQWDPAKAATPPGDTELAAFTDKAAALIQGAGQDGCGFEAQLEAWYRFLVDPAPYEKIVPTDCGTGKPAEGGQCRGPTGTDSTVLTQRKDFLRPDSLVVIAMLTDEDDCSVMEGGQGFLATQAYMGQTPYHLPRATSACKTNPASADCKSCGLTGSENDPECSKGEYSDLEDALNLRCHRQKQRFGIDFLYPTSRYADALTKPVLKDGKVNPLFCSKPSTDGQSCSGTQRDASQLVLAGIVGVPWQLIAKDPKDATKGYKVATELSWDAIAGDLDNYVDPKDPFMVPSIAPRSGTSSMTGESLKPPESAVGANSINGHEWLNEYENDLQYACVFELPQPKDCLAAVSCDCSPDSKGQMNPLCQAADGTYGTTQYRAKAYPTPRILTVLKKVQGQAVVASICAPQAKDATKADYAYRQAITAIVDKIKPSL